MRRYYKSKGAKIWTGIGLSLLVIGTLIGIGFILDATLPVAHDFFVNAIDWIKNLFTKSDSVAEPENPVAQICMLIAKK